MKNKMIITFSVLLGALALGSTSSTSSLATNIEMFETNFHSCAGYTKPAACAAQRHCVWVGSCVPR